MTRWFERRLGQNVEIPPPFVGARLETPAFLREVGKAGKFGGELGGVEGQAVVGFGESGAFFRAQAGFDLGELAACAQHLQMFKTTDLGVGNIY